MSKLVCLKTFANYVEADLAKALLENSGIKASVSADDAGGMRPDLAFTSGGIKLFVLSDNVDRASALLQANGESVDDAEPDIARQ